MSVTRDSVMSANATPDCKSPVQYKTEPGFC